MYLLYNICIATGMIDMNCNIIFLHFLIGN